MVLLRLLGLIFSQLRFKANFKFKIVAFRRTLNPCMITFFVFLSFMLSFLSDSMFLSTLFAKILCITYFVEFSFTSREDQRVLSHDKPLSLDEA